jgi:alpha-1,2-rhamnosyltransferase
MRGSPLTANSDQLLLLPDAYWTKRDIWRTVQRFRKSGTFVATIIYDLIPLTHPQYVGKRRSEKFKAYLEQVIVSSDLIVAISKTVRDEVIRYIETEMPNRKDACKEVQAFVLGAELHQPKGQVRLQVKQLFGSNDLNAPYLMVASFDPRKNHHQALDAFELLWANAPDLKLCFAGRVGAFCSDVIDRVRNHPQWNRSLFVYHDMNDAELQHAYQNCSGVLLPSVVEGFGLPLVESLWHGKKTFASDTPIHREVGGEHCEYFAIGSPKELAELIEAWEVKKPLAALEPRDHQKAFAPVSWSESTQQLVDVCLSAYRRRRASESRVSKTHAA